jgi:alkanesulfonate monooxygenase SsuD/methylene tetrahydromethanopterin reductase-like flavin-dependent oxidoreductase (luciferase family)
VDPAGDRHRKADLGEWRSVERSSRASWPRPGARPAYEDRLHGVLSFEGTHGLVPLVLAAAATERIEIMTAIAIAFARNPMVCAYLANDLSSRRAAAILGSARRSDRTSPTSRRGRVQTLHAGVRARAPGDLGAWSQGTRLDFRGEFHRHTLLTPFFSPSRTRSGRRAALRSPTS